MPTNPELMRLLSVEVAENIAPDAKKIGKSFRTLLRYLTIDNMELQNNHFTQKYTFVIMRWNRSIYQLIWRHMLAYYIFYVSLTILYYYLNEKRKR